jgi:transcriptional regulator GlxA family with amidase domain
LVDVAVVSVKRAQGVSLARRFGELAGQTPLAYLTGWRTDLAARRLEDTNEPSVAIARSVGTRAATPSVAPSAATGYRPAASG